MYINLFSIEGKYRGISSVSRGLRLLRIGLTKNLHPYLKVYEQYLDWLSKVDDTFDDSVLQMLIEFRHERLMLGEQCEIILYTDKSEEFFFGDGFLGFDAYWVGEGLSEIGDNYHLEECYRKRLNENGLFSSYREALDFCETRKESIKPNTGKWGNEEDIIPFCVCVNTPKCLNHVRMIQFHGD